MFSCEQEIYDYYDDLFTNGYITLDEMWNKICKVLQEFSKAS